MAKNQLESDARLTHLDSLLVPEPVPEPVSVPSTLRQYDWLEVKEPVCLMHHHRNSACLILPLSQQHSMALPSLHSEFVCLQSLHDILQKRSFQFQLAISSPSDEIVS